MLKNSGVEDIMDCLEETWINPNRKELHNTTHLAKCIMGRKIMIEKI
ncbi:MAG: hypothetical protein AB8U66_00080 [Rickettsiales endosymbiont of Dermacentor nuttalli]